MVARGKGVYELAQPVFADVVSVDLGIVIEDGWGGFKLEVSPDGRNWEQVYEGARTSRDGQDYAFTPRTIRAIRISDLKGVRATPMVRAVKVAGAPERYTLPDRGAVAVTTGSGRDAETGRPVAWVESRNAGGLDQARWTLRDDGRLTLDYRYTLSGSYLYHGIGFAGRDLGIASARALVRGPSPVWQNRMRGPELGVYDIAAKGSATLPSPAVAGYFAGARWVKLTTAGGPLTIASDGAPFLQLGARPVDFPTTTVAFPTMDVGFLNAIPAMGAKGQDAALTGPSGQPAIAEGQYAGRLTFSF